MVQQYENYRWLKQYRYWWLKGVYGCFCRRRHYCSYRFVAGENQARRCCEVTHPPVRALVGLDVVQRVP